MIQEIQKFIDFARMRYDIWFQKEVLYLPPPWTEDEFLKDCHFTNTHRDHDKANVWRKRNLTDLWSLSAFHTMQLKVWQRIGSLEDWKTEKLIEELIDIHKTTGSIFPRAYLFMVHGKKRYPSMVEKLVRNILLPLKEVLAINSLISLDSVNAMLQTIKGIGPFMANQAALDLNQELHLPAYQYFRLGPGSYQALQFMHSDDPDGYLKDLVAKLKKMRDDYKAKYLKRAGDKLPNYNREAGGYVGSLPWGRHHMTKKFRVRDARIRVGTPIVRTAAGITPWRSGILTKGPSTVNDKSTMSQADEEFSDFIYWMRDNNPLPEPWLPYDIEHTLCEFYKWRKYQVVGTGSWRRRYPQKNPPNHNIDRLTGE